MNITETLNAARLRAGAILRERRDRAAERKAAKASDRAHDAHAHSRFWLLNVPALATVCAAIVEVYWAVLFCIEATGHLESRWSTAVGSAEHPTGAWHFAFNIESVFVLIGLICATAPIVMLSMIWLPVQFAMRGAGRWRRGTLIAVGLLANVLVIVSGTVVMNYNRQGQVREALVVEQSADAGRAAIGARLTYARDELQRMTTSPQAYMAQAANVGAAEWERSYVAQARATNDVRLPMLERALGAARRADELRADIERLTVQQATAAPTAATAAHVDDTVGAELNSFAQYVEVWRPPFVAFICTCIGILGAWWTLAMLERLNPRDVIRSGWADEGHRIEDLRDAEPVVVDRDAKGRVNMKPPRRKYTEADTGEEIEETLIPAHYRKLKKGKPQQVHITPDLGPEEQGVPPERDGRDAELRSSMHQPVEEWSSEAPSEAKADPNADTEGEADSASDAVVAVEPSVEPKHAAEPESEVVHPEPPEPDFTDEALQSINALAPEVTDEPTDESVEPASMVDAEPEAVADERPHEPVEPDHITTEPAREPETDPARLIAAVAAE